jgi:uncharacterized protein (DUF2225 family)
MKDESPFFLVKIECPVCKTINEFECVKIGAYVEKDCDTDFCPRDREWQNAKYDVLNPLLFFMATCEHCYYTREFKQSFRDWKNDTRFRTYHQKRVQTRHVATLADEHSIVRKLGESLDPEHAPFPTAVCKFLLGIYDEMLMERPRKLDLGRFFLRIGWLFREHYGRSETRPSVKSHFARDIEKAFIKLKTTREALDHNLENISELVEEQFDSRSGFYPSNEFLSVYDGFKASFDNMEKLRSNMDAALRELAEQVQNNRRLAVALQNGTAGGSIPYGGFPSFEEFLVDLKTKWEYVPTSENEALQLAIEFYRGALEDGHEIQPGNQQIQATYMIAELSRRVARHKEAKLFFNNAIKLGQQFVFDNRGDKARTALAQRIVEMAITQGKQNLEQAGERV